MAAIFKLLSVQGHGHKVLSHRSGGVRAALSLPLISETESMNGEAFVLIQRIFKKTSVPGIFAFFSFVSYILLDLS